MAPRVPRCSNRLEPVERDLGAYTSDLRINLRLARELHESLVQLLVWIQNAVGAEELICIPCLQYISL